MKHTIYAFVILFLMLFPAVSPAQVFMQADTTGDAYACIEAKGYGYEVPDCGHAVRHIFEEWNRTLKKNVFVFNIHANLDDDRCINTDRQRTEIKTDAGSPTKMKAYHGETMSFRWKFQLDSAFQPSPNFCHIHQIKAGDGPDSDSPLMTITPRYQSTKPDKLQIIFTAPLTGETIFLLQTDLTPFKGVWVEAYEKIYFSETGTYQLIMKRVSDDSVLVNYSNSNIAMWRDSSTFIRPKYGIYRSLNSVSYLRDESVRFADFSLNKGTTIVAPAAPTTAKTTFSNGITTITWTDKSTNEDQFRIERSVDNISWQYIGTSTTAKFNDSMKTPGTYYYRVRAENASGNSSYSNVISSVISSISPPKEIPVEFHLSQNYPNPFNPATTIEFTQPNTCKVELTVFDANGNKVAELLDKVVPAGKQIVKFDGAKLTSGTYFYRLKSGDNILVKKLILLK